MRDAEGLLARELPQHGLCVEPSHDAPARANQLVVLLYDLGRIPEALQTWQELLAINPNAVTANGKSVRDLVTDVTKEVDKSGKQETKTK